MKKITRSIFLRAGLALGMVLVLALGTVSTAQAVVVDEDGVIEANEVIDDDVVLGGDNVRVDGTVNGILITAGQEVTLNGTVNGDLVVAGGTLILNGKVTGNVFAGGQLVRLNGTVDGTVIAAGSTVTLKSESMVNRNAFLAGFGVETEKGSQVARDLYAAGYQALLSGEVGRDAVIDSGALELEGKVGRNLTANVEAPDPSTRMSMQFMNFPGRPERLVDPGIRISKDASIGGKVTYTSKAEQADAIAVKPSGGVVYQTPVPTQEEKAKFEAQTPAAMTASWFLNRVRDLVTLLILGGLAVWLLPALTKKLANQASVKPWPAAGYGALTIILGYLGLFFCGLVVLFAGIMLSIITLGGLSTLIFGVGFSIVGIAFTVLTTLVSYGSKLVVAYLVGYLLMKQIAPASAEQMIWPMVVGVVLYVLVASIPFIGWLFALAATLVGIGAMWMLFRAWRKPAAVTPAS